MNEPKLKRLARLLLLLAAIIWGSSFFVMKEALDDVPVFFLLTVRFTVAAVLLSMIFWKHWKRMNRQYLGYGCLMGALLFAAYTVQTFGLARTTPGKNAFLTAIYCVLVPFLSWAVMHRKPDKYNMAAALLCIAGIGCVSLNADLSVNVGDALTLLGGFFYAAHMVVVAKYAQYRDIFLLTTIQFATTAALSALFAACTGGFQNLAIPAGALGSLAYLAVFVTAGALLFQNIGQKYTSPASASVLLSLEAPFGVLFSTIFYAERPTVQMMVGFGLIFVAVLCSETKFSFLKKRVDKEEEPAYNAE